MDMDAAWRKTLPDVDQLRSLYKAVRGVLAGPARTDEYDMVIHLTASRSGLSHAAAAAGLLTLNDMGLIELDPNTFPCTLKMNAMRKTDPESSAVWRALQAWRTGH
jgi:hypothetical protein